MTRTSAHQTPRKHSRHHSPRRSRSALSPPTLEGSPIGEYLTGWNSVVRSVTGSSLRNRNLFFPFVPDLGLLETALDLVHQRISERDSGLVPPDVAFLVQLLHQTSSVFPGPGHRTTDLWSRLWPLICEERQNLQFGRCRNGW